MTLIMKVDLDITKMYVRVRNGVSRSRLSKVRAQTGQTDSHTDVTEIVTTPHLQVVKIIILLLYLSKRLRFCLSLFVSWFVCQRIAR